MALAIYGKTGIGKTYTTYITLKRAGFNVLLVRSLEDLSEFENGEQKYTDIIFDDVNFSLTKPELLIHLCDPDFHCPIRILRNNLKIQPEVRKWFTHNDISAWQPVLASVEQQEAIERRLYIKEVKSRYHIENLIKKHISIHVRS